MKKHSRRSRFIVLLTVLLIMVSGAGAYGASSVVKVSGQTVPKTINQGSGFHIKGKITANQTIRRVEIGVTTSGGGRWTAQKYDNKSVNSKSFDISRADSRIKFGKLSAGTYVYRIYVHTADRKVHCVINERFTVKAKASKVTASASGCNYPTQLAQGKGFSIKGTAKASTTIQTVNIGVVYKDTGKWTAQRYQKSGVNARSFNVARADSTVRFGSLPAGTYEYRIYVKAANNNMLVLNKTFVIAGGSQNVVSQGGSKVTLSGCSSPGNYTVGKVYNARGIVSCDDVINKVEVGIVVAPTNKWSQYKYTANVGAKSFDLRNAADSLKFDMLPGGTFRYRMYAHTAKGVVIVFDKKFTVTPSGKTASVINWAKKIAADSRFTYGKGYGGYFTCPVCAGKYGKKEAQYTCMPFLAAAYAHGTGNSQLMNKGRHEMYLNNENFEGKLADNWFKLGLCRDLTIDDLQPGDVIIKYSENNDSGHAWMYGGGDSIIEAVPADVRVLNSGAETKLKRYGSSEGTPSKNYVMRYRH